MMNWKKLYMLVVCVLITYKKHVKALLEGVNHDQVKFFKNAKFGIVGYGGMKKWKWC